MQSCCCTLREDSEDGNPNFDSSERLRLQGMQIDLKVCGRLLSICIARLEVDTASYLPSFFLLRPQVEWTRFGARSRLAIQEAQAKAGARQLPREKVRQTARREEEEEEEEEGRVLSSDRGNNGDVAICYCNIWRTERTVLEWADARAPTCLQCCTLFTSRGALMELMVGERNSTPALPDKQGAILSRSHPGPGVIPEVTPVRSP